MKVRILKDYKPLFKNRHIYYVYYGGRGGGKTESIAQSLVILATDKDRPQKILCIRESQSSLSESVKSVIESWIDKMNLWKYFRVLNNRIECTYSGSEFIFMGMRSHNAVNVKSIHGVTITWIEEAEAFSKRSWDLLVPSVTRTPDPKIIISFNPYREDDIIYKTFVVSTPPPKSFIKKVTYKDNPYFNDTNLAEQRLHDEMVLPHSEYAHKWDGELKLESEFALFDEECLNNIQNYIPESYSRIIVAADPATTNKEKSNEYGVIVMALTVSGKCVFLEDLSGSFTPTDFANTCIKAYHKYHADTIVVEVNNGGDFIKSAILSIDPLVSVTEVRATKDKINRALPVANLAKIGLISHLPKADDSKIVRQMKLMTQKGYLGERGESPDRLDAYVWAVYELKQLSEKRQDATLFSMKEFEPKEEFKSRVNSMNMASIITDGPYIYIVKGHLLENSKLEKVVNIYDSAVFFTTDEISMIDYMKDCYAAVAPDTPQTEGLPVLRQFKHTRVTLCEYDKCSLDENVLKNLHKIKKYAQISKLPVRTHLNQTGELLKMELSSFKLEENLESGLIRSFILLVDNIL